mmetsp:Transcript_122885/g.213223  ORF Transcript_122885/g.213223 Transcript_122885/m.213223 type:complete len:88 (-) Transcript_122885:58-321(-)
MRTDQLDKLTLRDSQLATKLYALLMVMQPAEHAETMQIVSTCARLVSKNDVTDADRQLIEHRHTWLRGDYGEQLFRLGITIMIHFRT